MFGQGKAGENTISTSLVVVFRTKEEEEKKMMDRFPYASLVGSSIFAMVCTRPDIAYSVGVLSRFMANPGIKLIGRPPSGSFII